MAPVYAEEPMPVNVVNPVTISPPLLPDAPSNISVSGITDTEATISWQPVQTANQYTVFVNSSRWAGADSPGVTIQGLQPYTIYDVYVTAANDGGESGPSSTASFTTLPSVPTTPSAPIVTSVTENSVLVQWQPLPSWQYIQAYRVYVDGIAVADVTPQEGIQAASLTNLADGNHAVYISGINSNQEGPASQPVQFTTQVLPAITGLKMVNHSKDTIWICWDAIDASKYLISLNGQMMGETSQTSYELTGLPPNQDYELTVTAVMPDGNHSQEAAIQVGTLTIEEPFNKEILMQSIFAYVPDMMPGLIAVFIVGATFALARLAKISIGIRGLHFWRY